MRHARQERPEGRSSQTDANRSATTVTLDVDPPIALHRDERLTTHMLDVLAIAGVAIKAPCGAVLVPRRPPFPPGHVVCAECQLAALARRWVA